MTRTFLLCIVTLLLAACGGMEAATGLRDPFGVPQPFRGDNNPALIGEARGERPVYIGEISGLDPTEATLLRKAIATSAATLDVLASAETIPHNAFTLTGSVQGVDGQFALNDGASQIATFTAKGDRTAIALSVAQALSQAMGRLVDASPPPAGEGKAGTRERPTPAVVIAEIKAPTKGQAQPLKRSVSDGLAKLGVRIKDAPDGETYMVTAVLTLGAEKGGSIPVSIIWTVTSPDGRVLGSADQDNALPAAAVTRNWAESATMAGEAAAGSVAQIIATDFGKAH